MSENKDDHHLLPKSATGVFEPVSLEESGQSHEDTSVNSPSNNPPATLPLEQPVEVSPKQPRERTSIRKRNSVTESVGSGVSSKLGGGTSCHSVSTSRIQSSRHSLFGRQRYVKNHSIPDGHESQTNISGLRLGPSLTSLVSEDSFHQPTQMVISPHNPVVLSSQQSHTSQTKIVAGRFSVSPHHHLPPSISHKSVASGSVKSMKTRTKSERSSMAFSNRTPSPEPDVQFMMSDLALHEDVEGEGQQDALTPDMETVDLLSKDFTVEPVDEKELDDGSVQLGGIDDIEDLVYEVDENQRTVQSYFSVNTQDSANFQHAPLMCGNISFVREHTDISEQKKHYVSITSDTEMDLVTHFLRHYWGLKNPKIVLSVISNADNYKPWKNQRLRDDFQKGIIKAANATSMWIITNGIDAGVTKIIGDAVREFNMEQKLHVINHPEISDIGHKKRKLPIIGITPKDMVVPLSSYFHGQEGVTVQMDGGAVEREFYELNPDHSHFIIVEDMPKEFPQDSMRCRLEQQFRIKHGAAKVKRLMSIGSEVGGNIQSETQANTIPVVGLLVQGMPNHIEHILFYLNNKMPVLVLKGSGGLADIIAYAFEELHEKGEADPDFEENVLKPELIKMINRLFPTFFKDPEIEKLTLRDKIIQSVTLSREVVDGDHCYLTVVDVKAWASNMRDLDKFILRSLFRIENTEVLDLREQLQNDLQLTVDWNRPDLAWEIFQHDFVKVRIDKKMFEQSIVKKDREEFIDLFLTQGVRVHSYLNMKKLKYLFEKAEDREIFVNICLEGVVGIVVSPKHPLGEDFMPENLNRLIYKLSKIPDFFQPYKVYQNSVGDYSLDPLLAERKAIIYLIMWAVLMNRQKLAKTLWNRCDEPIGVALVCSRIYKELSKYTPEQYMRIELEANAKEFGEMALGALAICWRDSSLQAYIMLGKRLQDFNNKTVIEIAHDAGYIHFLAHPCCQKWLTKTFLGQLQIKELDWGLFRLPYWFKILMSVFLIFPMYIWITFIPSQKKKSDHLVSDEENVYGMDDSDLSEEDDIDMPAKPGMDPMWKKPKKKAVRKKLQTAIFPRKESNVSFFNKIYLLWTAPITKFWNTQVLYFTYLGLFCLATLWPVCGNQYLDVVLWCWTFVIELELVCRAYIKYHKYKTLSLVGNCLDIFVIMVFLVVLLFTRILHVWVSFSNYMTAKTFLCMFLIYFFYRLLGVYLPISPTLGPMLLRINRMISHDFVAFIRMFLIFMIAGGVAIQASLYPNWPLNYQLLARVITRPMYAMFLTQVSDLEGDALCTKKYKQVTGFCATGDNHFDRNSGNMYSNNTLMEELQTCPYSSVYAYIITLQYIFICKLILVTLLFAMFSLTIAKVDQEASELWKFQRYTLIADFIERFSLPPPFTVFSFLYLFLKFLHRKYMDCRRWCRNWRSFIDPSKAKTIKHRGRRIPQDTQFWKRVAREYVASEQAALERKNMSITQGEILVSIQDNMQSHRKQMKRMNDKVVELEKMIQSSRLCLETIQHKLEKTDVMGITDVKGKFIHVAARQSPYPGTAIARFPVFDKYVPLEVVYDVYDPKTFTLEKSKFPDTEVLYVDEDIIELIKLREEHQILAEEEGKKLAPIPEFEPKWNAVVTVTEDGERREIDRRSWIDINNQPLRYTLDALGIPQNPLGRTGIRGKGNLWRWGPNHVIKAVITRWRRKHSPMGNTTPQFLYVEGKKLLEFIAVQKDTYIESSFGLPGDVLHGYSTPNSILCKSFLQSVLDEPELAQKIEKFDQAEMIQFFSQFSATLEEEEFSRSSSPVPGNAFPALIKYPSSSTLTSYLSSSKSNMRVDSDQKGFSASLIYKGYLDDQRNTDNAWVEAEVWNFHFDLGDSFDARLKEESSVKWKEVSPYVKMFGNESVIVQEAARIHDAYH